MRLPLVVPLLVLGGCGEVIEDRFLADYIIVNWTESNHPSEVRSHDLSYRFPEDGGIEGVALGMRAGVSGVPGPIYVVEDESIPSELVTFTDALMPITPEQWVGWGCIDGRGREDSDCFDNADINLILFGSPVFFFDLESDMDPVRQQIGEKAVRAILAVYRDGYPRSERDAELAQEERFAIPEW
jgi:hypothetical protein